MTAFGLNEGNSTAARLPSVRSTGEVARRLSAGSVLGLRLGRPDFAGARKDTMHRVYGVAIWCAIAVMLFGLSMLFGFWVVLAVAGGAAAAGTLLYLQKH